MKRLLYLIFISLIHQVNYPAIADSNCGTVQKCSKAYPYYKCYGAKKIVICTNSPSTYLPKLRKPDNLPICVYLDDPGPSFQCPRSKIYMPKQVGGEIEVFNIDNIQSDLDCANYYWNCLCSKENSCNSSPVCSVKVKCSTRSSDFSKATILAEATSYTRGYNENECWLVCENSQILLNNSTGFTGLTEPDGYLPCSFINNSVGDISGVIDGDHQVYNLCDAILHEIGHLCGIAHYDENPCLPYPESVGIMESVIPHNGPFHGLSNDDKCAFMLLNCPSYTPVDEIKTSSSQEILNFPNPFSDKIRVAFSEENQSETSLIIYDIQGNKLLNITLPLNTKYYDIDMSSLSKGIYLMRLIQGKDVRVEKLVKY